MAALEIECGTRGAAVATRVDAAPARTTPIPGDLCNLLQVAASTFHLLDRHLDDDLRPLVRIGLSALRQAGQRAHAVPAFSTLSLSLGESHG